MKTITYYHDSVATRALERLYGPRLEELSLERKGVLMAILSTALFSANPTIRTVSIEVLGHYEIPALDELERERDLPGLLKAIANCLD